MDFYIRQELHTKIPPRDIESINVPLKTNTILDIDIDIEDISEQEKVLWKTHTKYFGCVFKNENLESNFNMFFKQHQKNNLRICLFLVSIVSFIFCFWDYYYYSSNIHNFWYIRIFIISLSLILCTFTWVHGYNRDTHNVIICMYIILVSVGVSVVDYYTTEMDAYGIIILLLGLFLMLVLDFISLCILSTIVSFGWMIVINILNLSEPKDSFFTVYVPLLFVYIVGNITSYQKYICIKKSYFRSILYNNMSTHLHNKVDYMRDIFNMVFPKSIQNEIFENELLKKTNVYKDKVMIEIQIYGLKIENDFCDDMRIFDCIIREMDYITECFKFEKIIQHEYKYICVSNLAEETIVDSEIIAMYALSIKEFIKDLSECIYNKEISISIICTYGEIHGQYNMLHCSTFEVWMNNKFQLNHIKHTIYLDSFLVEDLLSKQNFMLDGNILLGKYEDKEHFTPSSNTIDQIYYGVNMFYMKGLCDKIGIKNEQRKKFLYQRPFRLIRFDEKYNYNDIFKLDHNFNDEIGDESRYKTICLFDISKTRITKNKANIWVTLLSLCIFNFVLSIEDYNIVQEEIARDDYIISWVLQYTIPTILILCVLFITKANPYRFIHTCLVLCIFMVITTIPVIGSVVYKNYHSLKSQEHFDTIGLCLLVIIYYSHDIGLLGSTIVSIYIFIALVWNNPELSVAMFFVPLIMIGMISKYISIKTVLKSEEYYNSSKNIVYSIDKQEKLIKNIITKTFPNEFWSIGHLSNNFIQEDLEKEKTITRKGILIKIEFFSYKELRSLYQSPNDDIDVFYSLYQEIDMIIHQYNLTKVSSFCDVLEIVCIPTKDRSFLECMESVLKACLDIYVLIKHTYRDIFLQYAPMGPYITDYVIGISMGDIVIGTLGKKKMLTTCWGIPLDTILKVNEKIYDSYKKEKKQLRYPIVYCTEHVYRSLISDDSIYSFKYTEDYNMYVLQCPNELEKRRNFF